MKRIALIVLALSFVVLSYNLNAQESTGIRVKTSVGGTLFLDGKEITSLWANDSYTIPIERPGTYSVKMKVVGGREMTKSVVISARGIVDVGFFIPPNKIPNNIRIGTLGIDFFSIMWDSAGSNVSYNVYYNKENHVDSATVQRGITNNYVTINGLEFNKTYYIWVSVTEDGMEGAKSNVISQAPLETKLGQIGPAGGIVFYDKGISSDGWRYLEMAPKNTEVRTQWMTRSWDKTIHGFDNSSDAFQRYGKFKDSPYYTSTEIGDGKRYTTAIAAFWRRINEPNNAAVICDNLVVNGFNDWFLPNYAELVQMFLFYKRTGLGGFQRDVYWTSSSSLYGVSESYAIDFSGSGSERSQTRDGFTKSDRSFSSASRGYNDNYLVRAIRSF